HRGGRVPGAVQQWGGRDGEPPLPGGDAPLGDQVGGLAGHHLGAQVPLEADPLLRTCRRCADGNPGATRPGPVHSPRSWLGSGTKPHVQNVAAVRESLGLVHWSNWWITTVRRANSGRSARN